MPPQSTGGSTECEQKCSVAGFPFATWQAWMRLLAEGGFPAEALAAVKRRSRAIRHNGTQLDWGGGRPGEADDGAAYINLSYRLEGQRAALRLLVWPDRWVWVDCRRSTKVGSMAAQKSLMMTDEAAAACSWTR